MKKKKRLTLVKSEEDANLNTSALPLEIFHCPFEFSLCIKEYISIGVSVMQLFLHAVGHFIFLAIFLKDCCCSKKTLRTADAYKFRSPPIRTLPNLKYCHFHSLIVV